MGGLPVSALHAVTLHLRPASALLGLRLGEPSLLGRWRVILAALEFSDDRLRIPFPPLDHTFKVASSFLQCPSSPIASRTVRRPCYLLRATSIQPKAT
jgi:hypothetical protein